MSERQMLHTLEIGRVTSKQEALRWAKATLDVEWCDLIQGALDDRPEPWVRVHQPARLGTVDRTWAFIEYTQALAAGQRGRVMIICSTRDPGNGGFV